MVFPFLCLAGLERWDLQFKREKSTRVDIVYREFFNRAFRHVTYYDVILHEGDLTLQDREPSLRGTLRDTGEQKLFLLSCVIQVKKIENSLPSTPELSPREHYALSDEY